MPQLIVDVSDEDYLKLASISQITGEQVEQIGARYLTDRLIRRQSGELGKTAREIAYAQARREAVPKISELGRLGERIAFELLEKTPEFHSVQALNELEPNHRYADLFAVRDFAMQTGQRLVISVKTRNKYTNQFDKNGLHRPNGKYNILPKAQAHAAEVAKKYGAIPAWIAVQIDAEKNTYSCYFGYLSECTGNGIHMLPKHTEGYLCLAKDITPPFDMSHLHNL